MIQTEDPILKFCYIAELPDSSSDFATLQEHINSKFWKQSQHSSEEIEFNGYIHPFLDSGETWQKRQNIVSTRKKKRIFKIQVDVDLEMDWINQIVNHCLAGLASEIAIGFQEDPIRINDGIEFKMNEIRIDDLKEKIRGLRSGMKDKERGVNHYNIIQILGKSSVKGQPRLLRQNLGPPKSLPGPKLTNQPTKKKLPETPRSIRKLTPVWPLPNSTCHKGFYKTRSNVIE